MIENGQHFIVEKFDEEKHIPETFLRVIRYPVTEPVYRAHHWCLAHGVEVPEGYEVVGFGSLKKFTNKFLYEGGRLLDGDTEERDNFSKDSRPILRKIEEKCEHENYTPYAEKHYTEFMVKCVDCGMVRRLGSWKKPE